MITDQKWYIIVWFIYSLIIITGLVALFLRAFTDKDNPEQERARFLPLECGIPEEGREAEDND